MYIVIDDTKLNVEAGYIAYSAAVKWDTIKDKPSIFPPASHTQDWSTITRINLSSFTPSSHNHDDRYYTEAEIDTKFKNLSFVPVPIGGILFMYNTSNPAELYPNTTWELLPNNKFLKTGSTPLQQAGSNSISITKANLPNISLKVNSFSVTTQAHNHYFTCISDATEVSIPNVTEPGGGVPGLGTGYRFTVYTSNGGGQNTGTASPNTETLGSGTPLSINPEHITIKAWKRLS